MRGLYQEKNLRFFLSNEVKDWVMEKVALQARIFANQFAKVLGLSRVLPDSFSMRGNTGVGKTTQLRELLSQREAPLSGVLSPDIIKAELKKQSPFPLTNSQVHREGAALFALLQEAVTRQAFRLKFALDTRLLSSAYAEWSFIETIQKMDGKALVVVDVDGWLVSSVNRVLARDPYGPDPCVRIDPIVQGLIEARQHRRALIDKVKELRNVDYKLYCANAVKKFSSLKSRGRLSQLNVKMSSGSA